jgi:hypothetical protein
VSYSRRMRKLAQKTRVVELRLTDGARIVVSMRGDRFAKLAEDFRNFQWSSREREQILRQMSELQAKKNVWFRIRGAYQVPASLISVATSSVQQTLSSWQPTGWLARAERLRSALSRRRISRPPVAWMLGLAELLVSRKAQERVAIPIVRDIRDECYDALAIGRQGLATVVLVRGTATFLWVVLIRNVLEGLIKIAFAKH